MLGFTVGPGVHVLLTPDLTMTYKILTMQERPQLPVYQPQDNLLHGLDFRQGNSVKH
jgi:hypothetical protein